MARWSAELTDPAVLYVDEIELWGADDVLVSMTIESSHFGGRTRWPFEPLDENNITGQHQVNQAIAALAGMAGEREILGAATVGSGADVDVATDTVMQVIRLVWPTSGACWAWTSWAATIVASV